MLRYPPSSTFQQFLTDLYRLFDYWLDSAAIEKAFESLRDFMVVDQFLTLIPPPIRTFLKEHDTIDAKKIADLADLYAGAHKAYPDERKANSSKLDSDKFKKSKPVSNPKVEQSNSSYSSSKIVCFKCGEPGHTRNKCPNRIPGHKISKCFTDKG